MEQIYTHTLSKIRNVSCTCWNISWNNEAAGSPRVATSATLIKLLQRSPLVTTLATLTQLLQRSPLVATSASPTKLLQPLHLLQHQHHLQSCSNALHLLQYQKHLQSCCSALHLLQHQKYLRCSSCHCNSFQLRTCRTNLPGNALARRLFGTAGGSPMGARVNYAPL